MALSEKPAMIKSHCKLCGNLSDLQKSHVIPRFVTKSIKKGGRFGAINSRQIFQDGPKDYLLCRSCEQLFSPWESWFAKNIFHPVQDGQITETCISYRQEAMKFATSISWRALIVKIQSGLETLFDGKLSESFKHEILSAEDTWRNYLLGNRSNISSYSQHMYLQPSFDVKNAVEHLEIPAYGYFGHAIESNIFINSKAIFIFTKMGKIIIIGVIFFPTKRFLNSGKIKSNNGILYFKDFPTILIPYFENQVTTFQTHLESTRN